MILQRLRNLWAWSSYKPEAPPSAMKEVQQQLRAEIIYPDKIQERLKANPEISLDELIS